MVPALLLPPPAWAPTANSSVPANCPPAAVATCVPSAVYVTLSSDMEKLTLPDAEARVTLIHFVEQSVSPVATLETAFVNVVPLAELRKSSGPLFCSSRSQQYWPEVMAFDNRYPPVVGIHLVIAALTRTSMSPAM